MQFPLRTPGRTLHLPRTTHRFCLVSKRPRRLAPASCACSPDVKAPRGPKSRPHRQRSSAQPGDARLPRPIGQSQDAPCRPTFSTRDCRQKYFPRYTTATPPVAAQSNWSVSAAPAEQPRPRRPRLIPAATADTFLNVRSDENEFSQKDPSRSDLHIGGCSGRLRVSRAKGAVP